MIAIRQSYFRLASQFRGQQMRARSMRGSVFVFGAFGLAKVLQLGSNLILTRLLFPEAFGLMTLVTVFIGALQLMSDVGVQPSIVRSTRGADPDFLSTAWTLMVVRGFWITGLAWVFAWPYARLYDEALLFPLICVAAVSATASGFRSIEVNVRSRDIALGRVVALDLLGQVVSIGLTVLMAWMLQSVWGLAFGAVLGAVAQTVLSHVMLPSPNNRFKWDRSVLTEILTFGRWILVGTLFTYMGGQGIRAINGYLVGLELLAYLHIASTLGWMLGDLTAKMIGSIGYPMLSSVVRDRPHDLRRVTWKIRAIQTAVTTPGFIVLAVFAQPLIDLLYDDRYTAAGTFLAVAALNGAVAVLPMAYQNALIAQGNSRIHAVVMGISSGLKIVGTVVGFYLGGPVGMVLGLSVSGGLVYGVSYYFARKGRFSTAGLDIANLLVLAVAYAYILQIIDWNIG